MVRYTTQRAFANTSSFTPLSLPLIPPPFSRRGLQLPPCLLSLRHNMTPLVATLTLITVPSPCLHRLSKRSPACQAANPPLQPELHHTRQHSIKLTGHISCGYAGSDTGIISPPYGSGDHARVDHVHDADAPQARQHVRICAEGRLRAQSPMQRSAGPTGWWRGDVRGSATSATQPIQHPTHSDCSPLLTARIGPKLSRNIEHWWYDGSPANRSAAIP